MKSRNAILSSLGILAIGMLAHSCTGNAPTEKTSSGRDPHSYTDPDAANFRHLELDLQVSFDSQRISGWTVYHLDEVRGDSLALDNMGLVIQQAVRIDEKDSAQVPFRVSAADPILGSALKIPLTPGTRRVRVHYSTVPGAMALQWVPARQTASGKLPFLFTQSQSIYARSWFPCPDGPGIRFTYRARIQVPPEMMAVMSASNPRQRTSDGIYHFEMELPVPAYLVALAVGDLTFRDIGKRTGVYAPPQWIDASHWEFDDLEKMLEASEQLLGPYRWGRYDVLVLPASFPFGGMENPRLTFLSPTVLAGDRSLVSLLAHELAHSWSGNLVTNKTWNDFWLNEGVTTYIESRIMESLYGKEIADMWSILGLQDLEKTIAEKGPESPLTRLKLSLDGLDPEESMSDVAYEKGKALLRFLEERKGRNELDRFLREYFANFEFRSNDSEGFFEFTRKHLLNDDPALTDTVSKWIYSSGPPLVRGNYSTQSFEDIDTAQSQLVAGHSPAEINSANWTTNEWIYFIRRLPKGHDSTDCLLFDQYFNFSQRKNAEVLSTWLEYAILNGCAGHVLVTAEDFLCSVGRRKYLLPIYEALLEGGMGAEAERIYARAKPGYHPIARESIEKVLTRKI